MSDRRGYSLVELLIATVIISFVSLSLGSFVGKFHHAVATATLRDVAVGVATDQLNTIRLDPSYTTLGTRYSGTTTSFSSYAQMARTTTLRRVTGTAPTRDYTIVSITVTDPQLVSAVALTAVVKAP